MTNNTGGMSFFSLFGSPHLKKTRPGRLHQLRERAKDTSISRENLLWKYFEEKGKKSTIIGERMQQQQKKFEK